MNRGQAIFLLGGQVIAKKAVEFWASSIDAMLQFWLESVTGNSTHAKAIACARLAQLCMCMHHFFKAGAMYLCDGDDATTAAANAASEVVHKMCNRHVEELVAITQQLDVKSTGDTSLN